MDGCPRRVVQRIEIETAERELGEGGAAIAGALRDTLRMSWQLRDICPPARASSALASNASTRGNHRRRRERAARHRFCSIHLPSELRTSAHRLRVFVSASPAARSRRVLLLMPPHDLSLGSRDANALFRRRQGHDDELMRAEPDHVIGNGLAADEDGAALDGDLHVRLVPHDVEIRADDLHGDRAALRSRESEDRPDARRRGQIRAVARENIRGVLFSK